MRGFFLLLFCLAAWTGWSQSGHNMTRAQYFERFHTMAIDEMHRSGVPASITLAQGALESGDGNSTLAREANNHFGIKCHEDWNGKKIFEDDDSRNECFRKYASAEDSYRDHTEYLKSKSRYAFLFELDLRDYKGWARGLKKAGYATNPRYAERLISIIEEYGLSKYDDETAATRTERRKSRNVHEKVSLREIGETNRVKFIRSRAGDTYLSLTAELGKLDWELPEYNDAARIDSIKPGQVIYIQPKRNRAKAGEREHVFKTGETMHSVSQLYAIKLESLYKLNNIKPGTQPQEGTRLQLRRPVKTAARQTDSNEKISGGNEEDEIKVDLNLQ
jgi:hypothetical protein